MPHTDEDQEIVDILTSSIQSAARKMRASMSEGPDGPDCILTANEATIIYRILTEQVGLRL
jgi:hypothetical protein